MNARIIHNSFLENVAGADLSKWNIASFSKDEQDKVSVDKAAAAVAWLMAAAFNGSRALFWTLRAALGGGQSAQDRARHFRSVTGELDVIWRGGTK